MYELVITIIVAVFAAHATPRQRTLVAPDTTQHTIVWPQAMPPDVCNKALGTMLTAPHTNRILSLRGACRVRNWRAV